MRAAERRRWPARAARLAGLAGCVAFSAPAGRALDESPSQPILLRNIRIIPVTAPIIERGDLLLRDGRVARIAAGGSLDTTGVRIIRGEGQTVLPGLIDARTHIGLAEVWQVPATVDVNETSRPATPHLLVEDAINPDSQVIPVTRAGGVTTVLVAPGEANVLAGQSALVHLTGGSLARMIVASPVGVHATLGEEPKKTYGPRHLMPSSRMGIAAVLREELVAAQDYMERWRRYRERQARWQTEREGELPEPPEHDAAKETMARVLRGEEPLIVSAHRAADIELALRMAQEFGFRLILDHGTEAWKLGEEIARRRVPVLVGRISVQPSSMQTLGARYDNAALLHAAGS